MADRTAKILLVEPDPDVVEMLVASLSRRFNAMISCVATGAECLDVELLEPHDLVIAEMTSDGEGAPNFVEQLTSLSSRPVILLAEDADRDSAIQAMRAGVLDMFLKPFRVADLLDATERALRSHEIRRAQAVRFRSVRGLLRHVIRERRDLNNRIELICRDLVTAHRRLVHRVLNHEESQARPSG